MMLEEGEIITLDSNNKDYVVIKKINYNNNDYYYMMTVDKPTEIAIIRLQLNENNEPIIKSVTDEAELEAIMKITNEQIK